jgi:hypothetical protein
VNIAMYLLCIFIFFSTGEFANNLPDYQKIEIMMFIMGKFPQFSENEEMG